MKHICLAIALILCGDSTIAQELQPVQLNPPAKVRGTSVMEAFQNRQFIREYQETELSLQDLSDLLWATYGINRENGKRTAPTAQNSQDVNVYVCRAEGTYLYDAASNMLQPVTTTDIRPLLEGRRPTGAPVCILLSADMSRYKGYAPDKDTTHYYEMGAVDCGIISQNLAIFCAGVGLATGPRAGMDQDGIRQALGIKDTEILWLNHPVGYPKE
ncbi:MAG: nitroreductase family protein [Tannerellaceae bacterium]|nr:nitroreductase family protein [Tannerellaceae bacterium]MCD8265157.1 nitroreductase family protein [Tannerellaceae bacterium]